VRMNCASQDAGGISGRCAGRLHPPGLGGGHQVSAESRSRPGPLRTSLNPHRFFFRVPLNSRGVLSISRRVASLDLIGWKRAQVVNFIA
jgi:hypothetical protein